MSHQAPISLYFERADNTSALSNFICGINAMDEFIQNKEEGLPKYVEMGLTKLWIVKDSGEEAVAFFALSKGSLRINSDDRRHLHQSGIPVYETIIQERDLFPSIEIDYLAVREDKRKQDIGSIILEAIIERTLSDELSATMFLCVDALHTANYSAVGFYKKSGFVESEAGRISNLNHIREGYTVETERMYKPIFTLSQLANQCP